jgi:aminoglycoside 3-N-acetyltransferase
VSIDIRAPIREHGLTGKAVCLHASLRSFGSPTPDADEVIDAFLDEGCTVMVPTFSHEVYGVIPPAHLRPDRNGTRYDDGAVTDAGQTRIYDPSSVELSSGMGALPRTLVRRPDRIRGDHPISSFAALGPKARRLISGQSPSDVYAPLAALAKVGGYVVLIGAGLNRMTLIHLAEKRAGRVLFRRWANGPNGRPAMIESGGCSEGFEKFAPALAPVQTARDVGESRWRIFPAKSALNIATHAIRRDPGITHCGDAACNRCNDAVRGGPLL